MDPKDESNCKGRAHFMKVGGQMVSLYSSKPLNNWKPAEDQYKKLEASVLKNSIGVLSGVDISSGIPMTIFVQKSRVIRLGRKQETEDAELQQVILTHPCVSSIHCYIWCIQFDESVKPVTYLQNLSLNGTIINANKLLKQGDITIIEHGDSIEIVNGMKVVFKYNLSRNIYHSLNITQKKNWMIGEQTIGVGTFGKVQICYRENSNKLFAVKIVKIQQNDLQKEDYSYESSLLIKLKHPNIIRIFETSISLEENKVEIFQELAIGGDLFSYLAKDGSFLKALDEVESLIITYQIVKALGYLNDNNIVHRDLKLDNILIMGVPKKYPRIVIADFGIAKQKANLRSKTRLYTIVGTPEYCAPEVGQFRKNHDENIVPNSDNVSQTNLVKGYGSKCDVWSLGVITHIMLSGISPFYSSSVSKISEKVQRGVLYLDTENWLKVSSEAKDFIMNCINVDYEARYSINDCLGCSAWFNKGKKRKEWLGKIYQKIVNSMG